MEQLNYFTELSQATLPHALKEQKPLAQGNALGIVAVCLSPCKGKSLINCLVL